MFHGAIEEVKAEHFCGLRCRG